MMGKNISFSTIFLIYSLISTSRSGILHFEQFFKLDEGGRDVMFVETIDNPCICNIKTTPSNRILINEKSTDTIRFVPGQEQHIILDGIVRNGFEGNYVVTIWFDCFDQVTRERIVQRTYLTILSRKIQQNRNVRMVMEANGAVKEGDSFTISFIGVHGGYKCLIPAQSELNKDYILESPSQFFIKPSTRHIVKYQVVKDKKKEGNEGKTILSTCYSVDGGPTIQHGIGFVIIDEKTLPFILHMKAFNLVSEGQKGRIETFAQGFGTCSVTHSNSQRIRILIGETLTFTESPIEIGVLFEAIENNLVDGNELALFTFNCIDSGDDKESEFKVSVTVIDNDVPKLTEPGILEIVTPMDVKEGDNFEVRIRWEDWDKTQLISFCEVITSSPSDLLLRQSTNFQISFDIAEIRLEFEVTDDKRKEGDETLIINYRCRNGPTFPYLDHFFYVILRDGALQSYGDPHFIQDVFDMREKVSKMICYDIKGNANDTLFIYKQASARTEISVYGQLKDDSYMRGIQVLTTYGNVSVDTNLVELSTGEKLKWDDYEFDKITFANFSVLMKNNEVEIKLTEKNDFANIIRIRIIRSYLQGGHILDVIINRGTGQRNLLVDGILGLINNNRFKFYGTIQETESSSRGTIEINAKPTTGFLIERKNTKCWLINVKDLIYPFELNKFIYSSGNYKSNENNNNE